MLVYAVCFIGGTPMKKMSAVMVGLTAFWLFSAQQIRADEIVGGPPRHLRFAKLKPLETPSVVGVGPFSAPVGVPEQKRYPTKVALAKSPAKAQVHSASAPSLFGSAAEQFSETITVFGERIVPPTEVSGLEHFAWRGAKYESDEFQWTFKKFRSDTGRTLAGSDFIFRYRYPTEGAGPRGFRSGEVIVGFGLNIPLTSFRPIGLLFTAR